MSTEDLVRAVAVTADTPFTQGLLEKVRERVGGGLRDLWSEPVQR